MALTPPYSDAHHRRVVAVADEVVSRPGISHGTCNAKNPGARLSFGLPANLRSSTAPYKFGYLLQSSIASSVSLSSHIGHGPAPAPDGSGPTAGEGGAVGRLKQLDAAPFQKRGQGKPGGETA